MQLLEGTGIFKVLQSFICLRQCGCASHCLCLKELVLLVSGVKQMATQMLILYLGALRGLVLPLAFALLSSMSWPASLECYPCCLCSQRTAFGFWILSCFSISSHVYVLPFNYFSFSLFFFSTESREGSKTLPTFIPFASAGHHCPYFRTRTAPHSPTCPLMCVEGIRHQVHLAELV